MENLQFTYVMQLALGYWNSHPLFILVKLKIFEALDDTPQSFEELQKKIDISPFYLEVILKSGIALRLIDRQHGYYSNTSIASNFLIKKSSNSLVNWVKLMNRWSRPWTFIEEAITKGREAEIKYRLLGEDKEYLQDFILGNHEIALISINDFKENVKITGAKYILDIGGGAGTYSIALCESNLEMKAKVLELKDVLPITQNIINEFRFQERISVEQTDYSIADFGSEIADVILLSNMLLQEPLSTVKTILTKVYHALKWNGEVIIQGYFLDDNSASTLYTTLINLYAIVIWNKAESSTVQDLLILLREVGFEFDTSFTLKNTGLTVIKAKKTYL